MNTVSRRHWAAMGAAIILLAWGSAAYSEAPKLLRSEPADAATDVSLDVGVLRLTFDQDMRTDSFTCWKSPRGEFPPTVKENGSRWVDARTFELKLDSLKPGAEYFVQLNAEGRQGFRADAGGEALAVTTVRFKTVSGEQSPARQDVYDPGAETKAPAEEQKPAEAGCLLKWNAKAGQVSKMSQTTRIKLSLTISSGGAQQKQDVDTLMKFRFVEGFVAVDAGRPTRISRRVELAEMMTKDPATGEVQRQTMPQAGLDVEVRVLPDGALELASVKSGERSVAEALASEGRWVVFEPARAVKVGESWSLKGPELASLLTALSAKDGEVTLHLAKIEKDAQIGDVAKLEGTFKARMQLPGNVIADVDGTLQEDFVPAIGLPFLRHIKAKLRVSQTLQQDGQTITLNGDGELELVEERALLKETAPTSQPSAANPGCDEQVTGASGRTAGVPVKGPDAVASPGARPGEGAPRTGKRLGTIAFQRIVEGNEKAFSLLVPQGWRVEGGIVRVNPLTTDAAAQAIEAKCNMVIKNDEAGTVLVHFLPSVRYIDNRGQPVEGMFPPGSTMNGCPVVYKMSAEDYLVRGVFPQLRPDAQDVRVVEQKKLPDLARSYQQRAASIPLLGAHFSFDAALVTIEYTQRGTRFRERMLTILRDFGSIGAGLWDNNETVTFRAPADQFEQYEPVARIIAFSVQIDRQWLLAEIRNQAIRSKIVIDTQRELARIDEEMLAHRQKTNAEINNDMFLTLMGQEEYVNPYTGKVEVDSGDWKYRWVSGAGEVVFTDNESYEPNHDVNPPFNRTDFKRSAVRPRSP